MNTILTLCEACAEDYRVGGYRMKKLGKTTTKKAETCQQCGRKTVLDQYHVQKGKQG